MAANHAWCIKAALRGLVCTCGHCDDNIDGKSGHTEKILANGFLIPS
jgi:hypothetical protein